MSVYAKQIGRIKSGLEILNEILKETMPEGIIDPSGIRNLKIGKKSYNIKKSNIYYDFYDNGVKVTFNIEPDFSHTWTFDYGDEPRVPRKGSAERSMILNILYSDVDKGVLNTQDEMEKKFMATMRGIPETRINADKQFRQKLEEWFAKGETLQLIERVPSAAAAATSSSAAVAPSSSSAASVPAAIEAFVAPPLRLAEERKPELEKLSTQVTERELEEISEAVDEAFEQGGGKVAIFDTHGKEIARGASQEDAYAILNKAISEDIDSGENKIGRIGNKFVTITPSRSRDGNQSLHGELLMILNNYKANKIGEQELIYTIQNMISRGVKSSDVKALAEQLLKKRLGMDEAEQRPANKKLKTREWKKKDIKKFHEYLGRYS